MEEDLLELSNIRQTLLDTSKKLDQDNLATKLDAANATALELHSAWSQSNIGYHANVYYLRLEKPPQAARFDATWGLKDAYSSETQGDWREMNPDDIVAVIKKDLLPEEWIKAQTLSEESREEFETQKTEALSVLTSILREAKDEHLEKIKSDIEALLIPTYRELKREMMPNNKVTRDERAAHQGMQLAPHQNVVAEIHSFRKPGGYCQELARHLNSAISHINRRVRTRAAASSEKQNLKINPKARTYVNHERIKELKSISNSKFDVTKLIRIAEELNTSLEGECYLSMIMLTRAMLDHTPPIFGMKNFSEVANNYSGGGKSFKDHMQHLDNSSRKIADSYLHTQIRSSEILPNLTQVDFSNGVDTLLAEIVRLLK